MTDPLWAFVVVWALFVLCMKWAQVLLQFVATLFGFTVDLTLPFLALAAIMAWLTISAAKEWANVKNR